MKVALCSAFRNMAGRLHGYFRQTHALREHLRLLDPDVELRVVAVEGDSSDSTRESLPEVAELWDIELDLHVHCHGQPVFGSTERPERLAALSQILNAGFSAARRSDDAFVWVESDLLWTQHDLGGLIQTARGIGEICAPMVWAGEAFYDLWGFRGLDGQRFGPFEPYHPDFKPGQQIELSSAGSCLAMPGRIAAAVRAEGPEALVSWCEAARRRGHRVVLVPDFEVRHP